MKKFCLITFFNGIIFILLPCFLQSQVNMSRWIELNVQQGEWVSLSFAGNTNSTDILVRSGNNDTNLVLNTYYSSDIYFYSHTNSILIYGDVTQFNSHLNLTNITGINVENNTIITKLDCSINSISSLDVSMLSNLIDLRCFETNLSTSALDSIYCALPDRQSEFYPGVIYPVFSSSSPNHSTVLATNKQNALTKNWEVKYFPTNGGDLPATTGNYLCMSNPPINYNRYIELSVNQGDSISFDFMADRPYTYIKVESDSSNSILVIDSIWTSPLKYYAEDSIIRIYGNIKRFSCKDNSTKINGVNFSNNNLLDTIYCQNNNISSIDIKGLNNLTYINCSNNNLSTQEIDNIYCQLPIRIGELNSGKIILLNDSSSPDYSTVMATNKNNASNKNWNVIYESNYTDIPPTNGNYSCNIGVDMSFYISMKVVPNEWIKLNFKGAYPNTPIMVSSGSRDTILYIDTVNLINDKYFFAEDSTIWIFGELFSFTAYSNKYRIKEIDASKCLFLKKITCSDNQIKKLNLSGLTELEVISCNNNEIDTLDLGLLENLKELYCNNNSINYLDLSPNINLKELFCSDNPLNILNVSGLKKLETLFCYNTPITTLNIDSLTNLHTVYCRSNSLSYLSLNGANNLRRLYCHNNQLTTLNISTNPNLMELCTYNNKLSANVLDNIYCNLPDRTGNTTGEFMIIENQNSSEYPIINTTNSSNATTKNWVLKSNSLSFNITQTSGTYVCGTLIPSSVLTNNATNITDTSAKLNAVIIHGNDIISNQGFEWRQLGDTVYSEAYTNITSNNNLNYIINQLNADKKYLYRAFIEVEGAKIYGNELIFSTLISLIDIDNSEGIKIYPNPVYNLLNIETNEAVKEVILFDISGKKLIEKKALKTIDLNAIKNGIYFLKIRTDKRDYNTKIIKQR